MRCEPCASSQPVRQAALRSEASAAYPFLPVRMWTPAARLAEIVAANRAIPAGVVDRLHRLLSDRDFVFRGGWTEGTRESGRGTVGMDRRMAPAPA